MGKDNIVSIDRKKLNGPGVASGQIDLQSDTSHRAFKHKFEGRQYIEDITRLQDHPEEMATAIKKTHHYNQPETKQHMREDKSLSTEPTSETIYTTTQETNPNPAHKIWAESRFSKGHKDFTHKYGEGKVDKKWWEMTKSGEDFRGEHYASHPNMGWDRKSWDGRQVTFTPPPVPTHTTDVTTSEEVEGPSDRDKKRKLIGTDYYNRGV